MYYPQCHCLDSVLRLQSLILKRHLAGSNLQTAVDGVYQVVEVQEMDGSGVEQAYFFNVDSQVFSMHMLTLKGLLHMEATFCCEKKIRWNFSVCTVEICLSVVTFC